MVTAALFPIANTQKQPEYSSMEKWMQTMLCVCIYIYSIMYLYMHVCSVAKQCPTLQPAGHLCLWDFSGKNTGVGLPFPPPGDLPDPEIKPMSLASPALAGRFFTTEPQRKPTRAVQSTHTHRHTHAVWGYVQIHNEIDVDVLFSHRKRKSCHL